MKSTPIALFIYKRPEHTRKTLESLMANAEFSDSPFYVFCDGARNEKDIPLVQETRSLIRSYNLENCTIITRDKNVGLANSIIRGVTGLCNKYGRVIVVEDDLYLSPYFLKYMNAALDTYEEYNEVMHISGYMFPVKGQLPSTFFYRVTSSWGWGTWKRAWDKFESNEYALLKRLKSREKRHEFDIQGTMKYYRMLMLQAIGVNDSWAIRWYASVFLNNGLCLHPGKSLVNNIGHDDSGVHSISTNVYDVKINKDKDFSFTTDISENKRAITLMADFYRSIRKPIYVSVYNKIKQVVKGLIK